MSIPRYIAHRGLHDKTHPENSLSAFLAAMEKGFAIELDVRFTADKKMAVFHDSSTGRMCGEDLVISETEYSRLADLRLLGTDEKIPLFSEVLKLVSGKVFLMIELKDTKGVPDAEKRLVHMLKKYKGEYAVQSFEPFSVMRLRLTAPEITRGQLISTYEGDKQFLRSMAAAKAVWRSISKPHFISCDLRSITLDMVLAAADIGAKFITWTANSDDLMAVAESFSSSIIFENVSEKYFMGKK